MSQRKKDLRMQALSNSTRRTKTSYSTSDQSTATQQPPDVEPSRPKKTKTSSSTATQSSATQQPLTIQPSRHKQTKTSSSAAATKPTATQQLPNTQPSRHQPTKTSSSTVATQSNAGTQKPPPIQPSHPNGAPIRILSRNNPQSPRKNPLEISTISKVSNISDFTTPTPESVSSVPTDSDRTLSISSAVGEAAENEARLQEWRKEVNRHNNPQLSSRFVAFPAKGGQVTSSIRRASERSKSKPNTKVDEMAEEKVDVMAGLEEAPLPMPPTPNTNLGHPDGHRVAVNAATYAEKCHGWMTKEDDHQLLGPGNWDRYQRGERDYVKEAEKRMRGILEGLDLD